MDEKISILNSFWNSCADIKLVKEFELQEDCFWGSIQMDATPKNSLLFDVKVPLSYPLSNDSISIRFCCKNDISCSHINDDNSICILTPKDSNFENRLKHEELLLKKWRDIYYIGEKKDDRYEYPITDYSSNDTFFFTDIEHGLKKGEFGEFTFVKFSEIPLEDKHTCNYYIKTIGKNKCQWSNIVHSRANTSDGLFYFIEEEPVVKCRWTAKNWNEINTLLSQKFKEHLYSIKTHKGKKNLLHFLLGYKISSTEIHWQMIQVEKNEIPLKGQKIVPNYYEYNFENKPIRWAKTVNCSYNRYFGRGALPYELAEKRILIIGVGAVGSSLAKILTRGGAKNITLCDNDEVATGNICRSEYLITQVQYPKVCALGNLLSNISPFVDINFIPLIDKRLDTEYRKRTTEILDSFDYIFDCSSDSELAYIFHELKPQVCIINISISNKANELVCSVGFDFAHEKALIFKNLETTEDLSFYEGTGCWSPTFEASFYDINGMLNLTIQNIANKISNKIPVSTFMVKKQINNNSINLITVDY